MPLRIPRPLSRWFEAGLELEAVRFDHDALDAANPANARRYVEFVERALGVEISLVGTAAARGSVVALR